MNKRYNDKLLCNCKATHAHRYLGRYGIICLAVCIGLICIIATSFPWLSKPWKQCDNWRIFLNSVFSTIATVSFASVAWETIAKYTFSRDVVDMAGLSENIRNSGVITIEEKFSNIKWDELLPGKESIIAVFSYSTTWGKNNAEMIKQVSKMNTDSTDGGKGVFVVLPDPNNEELMTSLKYRFTGVTNLEEKIREAEDYYLSLGAEIEYHTKAITNSFYILDNEIAVMASFTHQEAIGGHTKNGVPAIITRKPGFIFDYIFNEVKGIRKTVSRTVPQHKNTGAESNE